MPISPAQHPKVAIVTGAIWAHITLGTSKGCHSDTHALWYKYGQQYATYGILAPVYRTQANCCYQLMHIASLSSSGTCVHLSFPIAGKPVAQKGFCAVSIYKQYVWLAICYGILATVYRTQANCCYQLMHIASLSSRGTCVHLSFPIAGKPVAQKGFFAVSI